MPSLVELSHWNGSHRYQTQTILGLLQSGAVLIECFLTKIILTARDIDMATADLPLSTWFVINWGFSLLAVPLAWTVRTISLERHPSQPFSMLWTHLSGLSLFIGLAWLAIFCAAKTGSSVIRMQAL